MARTWVYEGTPDQLVQQFNTLTKSHRYKVTVISQEPDAANSGAKRITFGMFPELKALTEEDFESAEWRGKDIEL